MKGASLGGVLLIGAYLVFCAKYDAGLVDDTLIFLRYAENTLNGLGVVFNPGDKVEGYTSPLWLLLLVASGILPFTLTSIALTLSSIFGIASVLAVFFHSRNEEGPWLSFCAALILCATPPFIFWTHSGMGTALFTFLLTTFFLQLERDCRKACLPIKSGVLFSFCILSRPEAAALVPLSIVWIYLFSAKDTASRLKTLSAFLAPLALVALHLLWRMSYYDAFLPNTYYAKAGIPLDARLSSGLTYTLHFFKAYFLHALVVLSGIFLTVRSLTLSDRKVQFRNLQLPSLLIFNWLLIVMYSGGDHFAMFRFFVPVFPAITILGLRILAPLLAARKLPKPRVAYSALCIFAAASLGFYLRRSELVSIVETLLLVLVVLLPLIFLRDSATFKQLRTHNTTSLVAGVLLVLAFSLHYQIVMSSHDARTARFEVELVDTWTRVGRWLKDNAPEDTTIASITVGAIPYYSGLRTLDLVGLTDTTIARQGNIQAKAAPGHQKYHSEYVLQRQPDLIIHPSAAAIKKKLDKPGSNLVVTWHYSIIDLLQNKNMQEKYSLKHIVLPDGHYLVLFVSKDFNSFPNKYSD